MIEKIEIFKILIFVSFGILGLIFSLPIKILVKDYLNTSNNKR